MQNSCKASSHRPEQNSSFYFVGKAIDFPYELRLYSDSVYSWAVTGLPKAALQTSCSLTTSVVIILLSGRDNLKCPRSSEMQGRPQELLTFFFFFNGAFSMPENGTAMNLHSGMPSLDSRWKTQSIKVPSTQPLSRELCQLARDDSLWLRENQAGAPKAQSVPVQQNHRRVTPERDSVQITVQMWHHFQTLQATQPASACP